MKEKENGERRKRMRSYLRRKSLNCVGFTQHRMTSLVNTPVMIKIEYHTFRGEFKEQNDE